MNAIVIPCHIGKCPWLDRLLYTVRGDIPIIVVTTDAAEHKYFEDNLKHHAHLNIQLFCCLDYIEKLRLTIRMQTTSGIINLKKFLALHYYKDIYEHILCIDCDSKFISTTNDTLAAAVKNYQYRIFGLMTNNKAYFKMNDFCRLLFAQEEYEKISKATADAKIYSWFFEAPLYKNEDLNDFFAYMANRHGGLDGFCHRLMWETFENIVYTQFLIAHRDAKVIDYSTIGIDAIPEFLNHDDLLKIEATYNYKPIWMPSYFHNDTITDIHMLCHMDRKAK